MARNVIEDTVGELLMRAKKRVPVSFCGTLVLKPLFGGNDIEKKILLTDSLLSFVPCT